MYQPKELNLFALVMISITAVMSLSSIAYMATIGLQNVAFFAFAAILFLLPSALISAELGSMLVNNNGGVYTWITAAFGNSAGVVAIWMEWFNNIVATPAGIAALVATFAYNEYPALAHNTTALFLLSGVITWSLTWFNHLPISKVAILSIIGGLFGMILPGILLIICAIYWLFSGAPLQVNYSSFDAWMPTASFATFALLVKVLGSYSGIQSIAFHTRNIKNPRVNIPIAILITISIIFCITTIASVSLASIVPAAERNALNGLIQAIALVLHRLNLDWLAHIISWFICIGMLAGICMWLLGPARGMQVVATQKLIPEVFARLNKHGMPTGALLIQGVICSMLATLFLLMPSIESAFAMLVALTSQFTVVMWIMIFVSAIRLRYSAKDMPRPFRVGRVGNAAIIFWATLGIIACICGFFLGLFPPGFSHVQNILHYVSLMIIADIIIIAIPFMYIWFNCISGAKRQLTPFKKKIRK